MSDEDASKYSVSESSKNKSSSAARSKGSGIVAKSGASSGARKADNPSAWLRSPTRDDASARARSYKRK